jgi:hypothetical protein
MVKQLLAKIRLWILRLLKADHLLLDEWLAEERVRLARGAAAELWQDALVEGDERHFLEEAYHKAQASGCPLGGYELRFAIYWDLGVKRGRWN